MKSLIPLALVQLPGFGRRTINELFTNTMQLPLTKNELFDWLVNAKDNNLKIKIPTMNDITNALEKANTIMDKSKKNNIGMLSMFDEDYPLSLQTIEDKPLYLFYKGNIECIKEQNNIAIIGTRNPTEHGINAAKKFGYIFAKQKINVVSGLAIGCDTYGHEGCIKGNGKAIAVLPCGLDKIYPASNKELAQSIIKNGGCIVSEYPIGTRPFKSYFVDRDRLQSGLSKVVLIVETDIVGGTMHTAKFTCEQGRILVAYNHPKQYTDVKQTKGNQLLIKEGKALPISNIDDIKEIVMMIKEKKINNQKITIMASNEQMKLDIKE
ncbi:DNA-processing protein DprA [Vallitalea guaymasensis]|uniref:DNA-processing protein DprA n=1 Tax=Vallitalea guaymasensis TaxID=1185412 RepID=UPI00235797BC|nr:DNA-processing protein DprA [Vallitalea guaymasensis]